MLIFGLSSVPKLSTDDIGLPRGFDKIAHFAEYLILAVLFMHGLGSGSDRRAAPVVLLVLATGLLIAGLDELYQGLIPGRHPSIFDFSADAAGLLIGTVLGLRFEKPAARREERT